MSKIHECRDHTEAAWTGMPQILEPWALGQAVHQISNRSVTETAIDRQLQMPG